ncbi:MAG TPA: hypothetical protein PK961_11270 [bacterium]|nr:hypothetical protein [bacterium]
MKRFELKQWGVFTATIAVISLVLIVGFMVTPSRGQDEQSPDAVSPTPPLQGLKQALTGDEEPTPTPTTEEGVAEAQEPEIDSKPTPEDEHLAYLQLLRQQLQQEQGDLETLREEVKKEIVQLEALRVEIDQRLAKEDEIMAKKIARLVKIYEAMRPDDLAPVLEKLGEDMRLAVLARMKQKTVSALLVRMDPATAASVSTKLLSKKVK